MPREELEGKVAFIGFNYNGQPLDQVHGVVRMVIPHLYGWKGAKYLVGLEFTNKDKPGLYVIY